MTFYIKQGDTLPSLRAQLLGPDNQPINLSGATVEFRVSGRVAATAVVEDDEQGRVRYDWRPGDTDKPGAHNAEFIVTFMGGATQRVPNDGYLTVHILKAIGGADHGA